MSFLWHFRHYYCYCCCCGWKRNVGHGLPFHNPSLPLCVCANNTNTYRAKIEKRIMHENKYITWILTCGQINHEVDRHLYIPLVLVRSICGHLPVWACSRNTLRPPGGNSTVHPWRGMHAIFPLLLSSSALAPFDSS